jgi:hypothetical protein
MASENVEVVLDGVQGKIVGVRDYLSREEALEAVSSRA